MDFEGQEAEIELTLEVTRKETGEVEIFTLKGRATVEENTENIDDLGED